MLSVMVLLVIVTVPPTTWMAPESAKRPFGALALASLPLIVELLIVSGPRLLTMRAAIGVTREVRQSGRRADAIVADRRVRERQCPPAVDAAAIRLGKRAIDISGTRRADRDRFAGRDAVIGDDAVGDRDRRATGEVGVRRDLDTTALGNHASLADPGIDSGLDRATPPVIVTPEIETVGSVNAPKAPIVSTDPPPRITVELAPAPTSLTLTSIVTPPAVAGGRSQSVSRRRPPGRSGSGRRYGRTAGALRRSASAWPWLLVGLARTRGARQDQHRRACVPQQPVRGAAVHQASEGTMVTRAHDQ